MYGEKGKKIKGQGQGTCRGQLPPELGLVLNLFGLEPSVGQLLVPL